MGNVEALREMVMTNIGGFISITKTRFQDEYTEAARLPHAGHIQACQASLDALEVFEQTLFPELLTDSEFVLDEFTRRAILEAVEDGDKERAIRCAQRLNAIYARGEKRESTDGVCLDSQSAPRRSGWSVAMDYIRRKLKLKGRNEE